MNEVNLEWKEYKYIYFLIYNVIIYKLFFYENIYVYNYNSNCELFIILWIYIYMYDYKWYKCIDIRIKFSFICIWK